MTVAYLLFVFLCVSFWGEPLWFVLLFVGPCLLFVMFYVCESVLVLASLDVFGE